MEEGEGGWGRKEGEVEREMVEGEVEGEMGGRGERNKLLPLPLPSPTLPPSPFPLTPERRTGHTDSIFICISVRTQAIGRERPFGKTNEVTTIEAEPQPDQADEDHRSGATTIQGN